MVPQGGIQWAVSAWGLHVMALAPGQAVVSATQEVRAGWCEVASCSFE